MLLAASTGSTCGVQTEVSSLHAGVGRVGYPPHLHILR